MPLKSSLFMVPPTFFTSSTTAQSRRECATIRVLRHRKDQASVMSVNCSQACRTTSLSVLVSRPGKNQAEQNPQWGLWHFASTRIIREKKDIWYKNPRRELAQGSVAQIAKQQFRFAYSRIPGRFGASD